jgi:hypothetical protein
MYGLIVKLSVVPGKREEMIRILKETASDMPGCLSYVVAKDSADENVLWVTEAWDARPVRMLPYPYRLSGTQFLTRRESFQLSTKSRSQLLFGELGLRPHAPTELWGNNTGRRS